MAIFVMMYIDLKKRTKSHENSDLWSGHLPGRNVGHGCDGRHFFARNFQQRSSSRTAEELPDVPSARRNHADVAAHHKDARPWAKAIKSAVVNRKMPPWFADPKVGHFANDMTMSDADINTQVSWVDNGALEGNPKDAPAPLKFVDGWNVRPDLVVTMPKPFVVPAKGTVNYKFFLVKTNFPEDMWVTAAEMRTGNSKVLHHGDPRSSSHRRSSHQPDRRTAALEAVPGCFGEGRGCMTLKITSIEIVSTIGESWTRFKMREGVRG